MNKSGIKRGFTLVELSVTLAVLSIVATMTVTFCVTVSNTAKEVAYQQALISEINVADSLFRNGVEEEEIQNFDFDYLTVGFPEESDENRTHLGFTPAENAIVDKMLMRPHGIILLTGPTGCGKSTTLYSFLKEINQPNVNIITVEDPVEYTMNGITQAQVNTKANLTFAAALRSILRQDPDVIMIGEIRDEETAEIAVRAAITGHLVLSTLHTNDAPGAITRLEDMKVPDYLVADALVGVIAQRLVKRLCPACKKRGKTTAKEMSILGLEEPISIYRPNGCQYCNSTGYKGRCAVHEVMFLTDEMKSALTETKSSGAIRNLALDNGMVSLWQSCRELVLKGDTSVQELMTLSMG